MTGQEAEEAIKRDFGRKSRADPMGSLFRSRAQAPGKKGPISLSKATAVVSESGRVESSRAAIPRDVARSPSKGKRVNKKEKRDKKRNKRKSKSGKERQRTSDRDNTTNGVSPAGAGDSRGHTGEAADAARQQYLVRNAFLGITYP